MVRTKYPLKPLEELRQQSSDAAKEAVAAAVMDREAQQRVVVAAEARARRLELARDAEVEAERRRLSEGALRASDIAMLEAYRARAAAEVLALHVRAAEEHETLLAKDAAQADAQAALAASMADLSVVEKDHTKWDMKQRQQREAAEDEEAQEAFSPRKG